MGYNHTRRISSSQGKRHSNTYWRKQGNSSENSFCISQSYKPGIHNMESSVSAYFIAGSYLPLRKNLGKPSLCTHIVRNPLGEKHFLEYNYPVCPHRLVVRTPPSQGGNAGSTPVGDTKMNVDIFHNYQSISGPLHAMHRCRMSIWLKELSHFIKPSTTSSHPLKPYKILDIGCGDGLAANTCALLGAHVIAVDSSNNALNLAKKHPNIKYVYASIGDFLLSNTQTFDFIFCLEVLEHWKTWKAHIPQIARSLNKKGMLTISTINKTASSFAKAIIWTEYIARWLPKNTHQWQHFIPPSEVVHTCASFGLSLHNISGMTFLPISQEWAPTHSVNTNYMLFLRHNEVY